MVNMMAHQLNELEHRWGERFQVNLPVKVAVNVLSGIDGHLKNVSLSGALLHVHDVELRVHALIEVQLARPSQQAAVLRAHVVRKSNRDVGVEWVDFAPNAVKDLIRALPLDVRQD